MFNASLPYPHRSTRQIRLNIIAALLVNALCGSMLALALAPYHHLCFLFVISILSYYTQKAVTKHLALAYGFCFGFGYFLCGLSWITSALEVRGGFDWLKPWVLLGIPSLLACFIAAPVFIAWHVKESKAYYWSFAYLWALFEWIRSVALHLLPWNLISYSFGENLLLIQGFSLLGPIGMSFFVVYLSNLPLYLNKTTVYRCVVLSLCIMVVYGYLRCALHPNVNIVDTRIDGEPVHAINSTNTTDQGNGVKIKLVQPNIPISDNFVEDELYKNILKQTKLSRGLDADIIIWPESAIAIDHRLPIAQRYLRSLGLEQVLIAGGDLDNALHYLHPNFKIYNSMYILVGGRMVAQYNKVNLVPFGEYIPFKALLSFFTKVARGMIDFQPGAPVLFHIHHPILNNSPFKIQPVICYEISFFDYIAKYRRGVNCIINITNDAWFGKTSGPYQHFILAKIRAVEHAIPVLRVANSGISGVIDPLGRVVAMLPINYIGVIDTQLIPHATGDTPYSFLGDWVFATLACFYLLLHIINKQDVVH
ncbi:apolipoprotein N-acyltransferase [Candidatus Sarmatiella mevalonica]|uniref:apolipoprotein N-acyltransferase n=1 Tax=Candidatus Sarmatiella mevalonica TaxID=2770581 RepID=UPI001922FB2A|nr:apolipoprotein N-acyltransferase [Candidatus Sarmatiella mevalonica]